MSAKFAFIDAEKARYSIVKMCAWMTCHLGLLTSGARACHGSRVSRGWTKIGSA